MHGHRVELRAAEVITPVQCLRWHLVRVRVGGRVRARARVKVRVGIRGRVGVRGMVGVSCAGPSSTYYVYTLGPRAAPECSAHSKYYYRHSK